MKGTGSRLCHCVNDKSGIQSMTEGILCDSDVDDWVLFHHCLFSAKRIAKSDEEKISEKGEGIRKIKNDLFLQVVFFGRGAWIRTRESRTQKPLPCRLATPLCFICFYWSGRQDLNLRPPDPKSGALPNCATSRCPVHLSIAKGVWFVKHKFYRK